MSDELGSTPTRCHYPRCYDWACTKYAGLHVCAHHFRTLTREAQGGTPRPKRRRASRGQAMVEYVIIWVCVGALAAGVLGFVVVPLVLQMLGSVLPGLRP